VAGLALGLAILAFSVGVEVEHQIVVLLVFCALKLARTMGRREAIGLAIDAGHAFAHCNNHYGSQA
jgi:hypothetical protein